MLLRNREVVRLKIAYIASPLANQTLLPKVSFAFLSVDCKNWSDINKIKIMNKNIFLVVSVKVGVNLKIEILMKNEIFGYVKQFFTSFPKIYMLIV